MLYFLVIYFRIFVVSNSITITNENYIFLRFYPALLDSNDSWTFKFNLIFLNLRIYCGTFNITFLLKEFMFGLCQKKYGLQEQVAELEGHLL